MKNDAMLKVDNEKIELALNQSKKIIFTQHKDLFFVDKRFSVPDKLNVIGVSPEVFSIYKGEKLLLLKDGNKEYLNVTLVLNCDLKGNEFVATSYIKDALELIGSDIVFLCKYNNATYTQIYTQRVDNIREHNLVVSNLDCNGCPVDLNEFELYEIYNSSTYDSLIVKASHIKVDANLPAGTIRLNRKQRISLGLELPLYLSKEQWGILSEQLSGEEIELFNELYITNDYILDEKASYDKKQKCQKIIKTFFGKQLKVIPVVTPTKIKKKNLLQKFCDFYVGKSTISLMAKRPYENDEGLDIVRMTRSNMNLLGIDEMDKVILQYKNKKIRCRVLELDSEELFLKTNRPVSTDLAIGIPIHLRKKLGILDLSASIKVDRDTAFIFKKSINEQVVPILLTLFSTNLFSDSSIIVSALLSLVAVPIVLYFNLSSKRNMRT